MAKKKSTPAAPAAPAPEATQQPAPAPQTAPAVPPTPPVAAAPVAPTAPPKPPKVEQNGISRPGADTTTGKVWAFADSISAQLKAPAPRADVMKACEAAGINAATAATQYGKWRKFNGLKKEEKPAPAPVAVPTPTEPAATAPVAAAPTA